VAFELVIRGGRLAESGAVADIAIQDGRIAQIGGEMHAARELDASGMLLLPGGVDAHVHLSSPPGEQAEPRWVDDFASGSAAAFAGGITTLGNMTFLAPGEPPLDGLARETASVEQQSMADVFLHPVLVAPDSLTLEQIPHLIESGCSSIKVFLPRPNFDQQLVGWTRAIELAGAHGLISMLHCEDFSLLVQAVAQLSALGHTDLRYFPESRPPLAEVVATQRAVAIAEATGAPVYIVHLSCERALRVCAEAQARGVPVFVETRPLYLHLTQDVFASDAECGLYVGQPPLRALADVQALWSGLRQGTLHTVCTDHAPWSRAAKLDPALSITKLRPGVENLQLLVPMLYSEGVRTGRIGLQRWVELVSTNAARLFGLYPRKGTLAIGSDADVVVFDPERSRTVSGALLLSNADYSVYEGWQVTGWPVLTIRRGEIVYESDRVLAQPGSGQLLSCGPTMAAAGRRSPS
jgi:dihydropyrimidinase